MKLRLVLCAACVLLLTGFVVVRADEKSSTTKKSETTAGKGRLTKPWSEMTDLTDDEKGKIKEIHTKALDDMKQIQEKEKTDIMALLTDDQKTEAKKIMDEQKSSGGKKMKSDASAPKADDSKK